MIAMIAGDDYMRNGPIPIALAHAGFDARETFTTDEAVCTVGLHGAKECVLILDACSLDRRAGSATWNGFLNTHAAVPAVVVTQEESCPGMAEAASEAHRILLESPFDAAAVVVAARQAASNRRLAFRRARQQLREAG